MKRPPFGLSLPKDYQPPGWLAALVSADAIRHDQPYGFCVPCRLLYVHDGDSIMVTLGNGLIRFNVRLLDCWCPELKQPGGTEARRYAEKILSLSHESLSLFVPLPSEPDNVLSQLTSMGRLLGYLFVSPDRTLNEMLVAGGHATAKKEPKPCPQMVVD